MGVNVHQPGLAALADRGQRRSGMPSKSAATATGMPWKLPPESTAGSSSAPTGPAPKISGLSTAAFSSVSTMPRTIGSASRAGPWTWGMQRSE